KNQFPNIYTTCLKRGVDISKDWIPVVPAVHYLCGGIVVDLKGKTSLTNLFACGECSSTGLHGANRLASNSLLEALVYAQSIFEYHKETFSKDLGFIYEDQIDDVPYSILTDSGEFIPKIQQLQALMSENAGIVRSTDDLKATRVKLQALIRDLEHSHPKQFVNTALCEYRNMLLVGQAIIEQSIHRKVNKGGYYNSQL